MSYGDSHPEMKPLTKAETAWIIRLEKLLNNCPSKRIALVTIGDPSLTVVDDTLARKYDFELHDGNADRNGVVLAHISGDVTIHGVSG